jgi:predicted lipoprotein with Yx(FWY)xxD motif
VNVLRAVLPAVSVAVLASSAASLANGSGTAAPKPPVSTFKDRQFGKVLSRPDRQVLYYWSVEKRAGGRVRCVRSCARAWPPLVVASAKRVPRKVAGIRGVFGTVRRPDGRLQVTRNGLPLYTYAHERPRQVLCNNVNGWFVVRV